MMLDSIDNMPNHCIIKEFAGYFANIISNMIEVRHDKLFVKTFFLF